MITLKHLNAVDFKRHAALDLPLSPGFTAIRGENWAGKSSVLHAILFALFGTAGVPGKKERIPRRGASNCRVELAIDLAGEPFTIARSLTAATVTGSEGIVASSQRAVTQWVEDQLRLDLRQVMELGYSRQTETAALLTLGAAALNDRVALLSGADYVDKLVAAALKKATLYKGQAQGFNETELDEAADSVAANETAVNYGRQHLESAESQLQIDREVVKTITKNRENADQRFSALSEYMSWAVQVSELEEDLEAIPAAVDSVSVSELEEEVERLKGALSIEEIVEKERARQVARYDELDGWLRTEGAKWKLLAANDQLPLLVSKANAIETEVERVQEFIAESRRDQAVLQNQIKSSICAGCNRPFDETHDVAEVERELATVTAQLADQTSRLAGAKSRLVEARRAVLAYPKAPDDWQDRINVVELELRGLQCVREPVDLTGARNALRVAQDALAVARAGVAQAAATQRQRETLEARAAAAYLKADETYSAVSVLLPAEDLASWDAMETAKAQLTHDRTLFGDQYTKAQQAVREAEILVQQHTRTLDQATVRLEAAQTRLAQLQAAAKRSRAAEAKAGRFNAFARWLKASETRLLGELWESIMASASEILRLATDGHATEIRRSDEGEFLIVEDGEESAVTAISGGMCQIAGTAVRLAMADLLPTGLGFVLLDEPSSELNDHYAALLAGALRTFDRQVVLVTHREGDEIAADEVIVLSREG